MNNENSRIPTTRLQRILSTIDSEENMKQKPTCMSVVNQSHVVYVTVVVEHKVRESSKDSLFWLDINRRLPFCAACRKLMWPVQLIFVNSRN